MMPQLHTSTSKRAAPKRRAAASTEMSEVKSHLRKVSRVRGATALASSMSVVALPALRPVK